MTFTKIQVIKILRQNIPGLGLGDAKNMVDDYEMKDFENRVARYMGEEARGELRQWALLYNMRFVNSVAASDEKVQLVSEDWPDYHDYDRDPQCNCTECVEDRVKHDLV